MIIFSTFKNHFEKFCTRSGHRNIPVTQINTRLNKPIGQSHDFVMRLVNKYARVQCSNQIGQYLKNDTHRKIMPKTHV